MHHAKFQFLGAMGIFGTIGLFIKYIPLPSATIAFFRGVVGLLFLAAVMLLSRKKPDLTAIGRNLLILLLAGGMGTRLGVDGPKGAYDIGITKPLYIFEQQMNNLKEVVEQCGVIVPLYIMTSDKNYDTTVSFLKEKDFFGLQKSRGQSLGNLPEQLQR